MKTESGALAACASWRACAVVRGKLRVIASAGPGAKCFTLTLDLPGKPVAVHPEGPTVLLDDGRLLVWSGLSAKWQAAGDLFEDS